MRNYDFKFIAALVPPNNITTKTRAILRISPANRQNQKHNSTTQSTGQPQAPTQTGRGELSVESRTLTGARSRALSATRSLSRILEAASAHANRAR